MGNAEEAEDALQDGLLSAFRNLRSFKGHSKFFTWLPAL
jgi:DNA-directed RNA polymerase specialized sigma24 family protein